jgi:hypothetical protein
MMSDTDEDSIDTLKDTVCLLVSNHCRILICTYFLLQLMAMYLYIGSLIFFGYCYSILLNSHWSRPLCTQLPRAIDSLCRNATNVIIKPSNNNLIDNQHHNHYSTIVANDDAKNSRIKFFANNPCTVDEVSPADAGNIIVERTTSSESDHISATASSNSRATHSSTATGSLYLRLGCIGMIALRLL